ncbi:enoyl-CoA hydratase-related protein [Mycobacterium arosiense]|uniref:Crotonase n=1 Tax=Mycobacterium arosiense ATCC BAA-1401 = DSM 45069 TaxID=1265311 RepID=A0A1W9ZQ43_MYCAI|nr:enoyl-CoA hydratase-related protein [Mycobacterium arosiense]ORA19957.1 crotonase [Mycobacterium arosiense ATCC BAA-1401 = DSM 45069]
MNGVSVNRNGAVLRLVLDRPEKLNAVDTPMLNELLDRLLEAADDDSVRAVQLCGAGRAFCSGGDLSGGNTKGAVFAASKVVQALTTMPQPVIAGVHGPAVGIGCPLALACDLVVAARSAYFQLAFTRVGLMLDGGASALLPAAIGRARTARMAMTAEKISAADAFDWGMISHVVGDDAYDAELTALTNILACGPTQSYRWIKRALAAATLTDLEAVQAFEAEGQRVLVKSNDFHRATTALRKGRQPKFQGD